MNQFDKFIPFATIAAVGGLAWFLADLLGVNKKDVVIPDTGSSLPRERGKTCMYSYPKDVARKLFPQLAAQVYDAKGLFIDNESKVIDAFNRCKTKGDVYLLAQMFSARYSMNIYEYLNTFMNDRQLTIVKNRVAALPCNLK